MSSIDKMHESGLRCVYNDYNTQYVDLLRKVHTPNILSIHCIAAKYSQGSVQGLEWSTHAIYIHTKQKQPQITF